MRIHSFRAGFATNSSSSHSVILLPPNMGWIRDIDPDYPNTFGWDHFRLVSEEDKLRYLAAQLFSNYRDQADTKDMIIQMFDAEIEGYAAEITAMEDDNETWMDTPSVDHQSVFTLPKTFDEELTRGMIKFFRSPRVVVLGGNDNTDEHHNTVEGAETVEFFHKISDTGRNFVTRQDGNFWTLFDSDTGNKVRFSFDSDDLSADSYVKASVPELIDVKITDFCRSRCAWCYQSSTEKGKHAPLDKIVNIANMLGELKVFEVAIGGGEPTSHPFFVEILHAFKNAGVVPNFTTFTDKWLDNEEIVKAVRETVGGIGVSCPTAKGLELVSKIKEGLRDKTQRFSSCRVTVSAQHVIGSVPIIKTTDFIKAAFADHIPVLLLGFKNVGFGKTFERFDDASLETYVKLAVGADENYWAQLSVDTALVDQYPNLITVLGVPNALVTSREGAFSCYIDAVTDRVAASSYVEQENMFPFDASDVEGFKNRFASF